MTILPSQCTNSYWVTTPSLTQCQWPPRWELQSCWDSQLANRVLPGAWHTVFVSPQHQGQSYHKQVDKSWLSSLGQGSPRRSRNDPHLHTPAHNAMVGNPSKSNCEIGTQQFRSKRDSCCVKWVEFVCKLRKACPCSLGGWKGFFFFSYPSSAALSRLENRFKRIRIWFLSTRNIRLFSFPIVI